MAAALLKFQVVTQLDESDCMIF